MLLEGGRRGEGVALEVKWCWENTAMSVVFCFSAVLFAEQLEQPDEG